MEFGLSWCCLKHRNDSLYTVYGYQRRLFLTVSVSLCQIVTPLKTSLVFIIYVNFLAIFVSSAAVLVVASVDVVVDSSSNATAGHHQGFSFRSTTATDLTIEIIIIHHEIIP